MLTPFDSVTSLLRIFLKAITHNKIALEPPKALALPVSDLEKQKEAYYLEELCKFVGLGCDPDDEADLTLENFLPYEK